MSVTGLAGEYFVAAELFKRGWQIAMTLGNSKAIDLVLTKESGEIHRIQVKTLRSGPNCFTLHIGKVKSNDFYVFVYLNGELEQLDYFILN